MNPSLRFRHLAVAGLSAVSLMLAAGASLAADLRVVITLRGSEEVPPIATSATGTGTIVLDHDGTLSGSITVNGMRPTAAHIHDGARGQNGPVAIGLVPSSENTWSVPAGTKLSEAQARALKSGQLYVNVHSAAHQNGEIRAQLQN